MIFGRSKQHELEKELAYLRGKLEALEKIQNEKPARPANLEESEDIEGHRSTVPEKVHRRINKLHVALVEKRLQALERRLGLQPKEILETQDYNQENQQDIELSGGNPDLLSALDSNPMLKIAINMFLRQYGTSIDDLRRDPSKLIPLLETILAKLKEKQQESQATGQAFNPYDPTLFMKK